MTSNRYSHCNGFSIIGLVITIAVTGVIAYFVMNGISGNKEDSNKGVKGLMLKHSISKITQALSKFKADNETFPTTEHGLGALVTRPSAPPAYADWKGPYIEASSIKDPWGRDYYYRCYLDEKGYTQYTLKSLGPDGKEGGGDDVE